MKKLFTILLMIILGVSITGCTTIPTNDDINQNEDVTKPNEDSTNPNDDVETPEEESYTLTFNTNGGNNIEPMNVDKNEIANLPTPTKNGYVFTGWYLESGLLTPYSQSVEKIDRTLYANWQLIVGANGIYDVEIITTVVMPEVNQEYENGVINQNDIDIHQKSYENFVFDMNTLEIQNWGGLSVKFINNTPFLEFNLSKSYMTFMETASTTTSNVDLEEYDVPTLVSGYLQGSSISSSNPTYNTAVNPYRVMLDGNYEVNLKLNGGTTNELSGEHFGYLNVQVIFKSLDSEFVDVSNIDVLEDGIYKVDSKIAKAYQVDSASMADNFNSGYAYIEVKDGKMVMHKENAISQNYLTSTDTALNQYGDTATMALMSLRKFNMNEETYYDGITNEFVDFEVTYSNSNSKTFDNTMYSRYINFNLDSIHDDYLMEVAVTGLMLLMNSGAQNMVLDINENTIVKVDSLPYALTNQTFVGEELELNYNYEVTFGTWDSSAKVYTNDMNALETNYKGSATDLIIAYSLDLNSENGFEEENLLDTKTTVTTTKTDTGVEFNTTIIIYLSEKITEEGHYLNFVNLNAFTEYITNGSTVIDVITTSLNINSIKNINIGETNREFYDDIVAQGEFVMLCLGGLDPNNLSRIYSYYYTILGTSGKYFGYTNIYNPDYSMDMSVPSPNSNNPTYISDDYVFEFTISNGTSFNDSRPMTGSFKFTL